MAYAKRYPGGFVDKPTLTTPTDAAFFNAVEAALLALFDANPGSAGMVQVWNGTKFAPKLLTNAEIDAAAAIAKSKLAALNITDADIAGAAAIAKSKLALTNSIVDADINSAAAISKSKIAGLAIPVATTLPGSPSDGDQAILVDSTGAPTYEWLFQWNATAAKWLFIGGAPAVVTGTNTTATSATWPGTAVTGMSFTIPRAGTYVLSHGFYMSEANDTDVWMSPAGAGVTAADALAAVAGMRGGVASPGMNNSPAFTIRATGMTAAALGWQLRHAQALAGVAQRPWASILPVAVT